MRNRFETFALPMDVHNSNINVGYWYPPQHNTLVDDVQQQQQREKSSIRKKKKHLFNGKDDQNICTCLYIAATQRIQCINESAQYRYNHFVCKNFVYNTPHMYICTVQIPLIYL